MIEGIVIEVLLQ